MSENHYADGTPIAFRQGPIHAYGPGTPEYHNGRTDKADRVRKSILANRLKGVLEGYAEGDRQEPRATREELVRLQNWVMARLAWLNHFPEEPQIVDGPCVVVFSRTVAGQTTTHAALRVPSGDLAGLWVATSPGALPALSWEDLMVWVADGTPDDRPVTVEIAGGWTTSV